MAKRVSKSGDIVKGDYYEDCRFHPCLCIKDGTKSKVAYLANQIHGISLIDGSVNGCNVVHCGIRKLSLGEVIKWKLTWPLALSGDKGKRKKR